MLRIFVALAAVVFGTNVRAATTLEFWHAYKHAQTHEMHYGFHLKQYKRGLFWGSCGPSTTSLQWSFTFDLAGDGPAYTTKRISVSDDNGKAVHIVAGKVDADIKRLVAKVDIEVETAGRTNKFAGNGEYRIHKLK